MEINKISQTFTTQDIQKAAAAAPIEKQESLDVQISTQEKQHTAAMVLDKIGISTIKEAFSKVLDSIKNHDFKLIHRDGSRLNDDMLAERVQTSVEEELEASSPLDTSPSTDSVTSIYSNKSDDSSATNMTFDDLD